MSVIITLSVSLKALENSSNKNLFLYRYAAGIRSRFSDSFRSLLPLMLL